MLIDEEPILSANPPYQPVAIPPSDHLRTITSSSHQSLHKQGLLRRLLSSDVTLEDVQLCLVGFDIFYQTLHQYLIHADYQEADASYVLPYIAAHQIWLQYDLNCFDGVIRQQVSDCIIDQSPFNQPINYLGVLYVTEGSLLGGSAIAKHLCKHFDGTIEINSNSTEDSVKPLLFKHFSGYGETINRKHFFAVKERIDNGTQTDQQLISLTNTALDTFQLIERIFDTLLHKFSQVR